MVISRLRSVSLLLHNNPFRYLPLVTRTLCLMNVNSSCAMDFAVERSLHTFSKLSSALEFMHFRNDASYYVFAWEHNSQNRLTRRFVVSDLKQLWRFYVRQPAEKRMLHEIIPAGIPCRLFLDIEFYYEFNPGIDGVAMVKNFLTFICEQLNKCFGLNVSPEADVLVLNSYNEKKFSRHVLFHLPNNYVFADVSQTGMFVDHCLMILSTMSSNELEQRGLQTVFVKNSVGERIPVCDVAVYGKNKSFRCFLSRKSDRNNTLVLGDGRFYAQKCEPSFFDIFCDSLVTNVGAAFRPLPMCDSIVLRTAHTRRAEVSARNEGFSGTGPSPYPAADNFVLDLVRKLKPQACIRSWRYFPKLDGTGTLMYDPENYRFCHRIGREHRSNHVRLIVNLDRGHWFQKCFDPDCERVNFRSESFQVPQSVLDACRCLPT